MALDDVDKEKARADRLKADLAAANARVEKLEQTILSDSIILELISEENEEARRKLVSVKASLAYEEAKSKRVVARVEKLERVMMWALKVKLDREHHWITTSAKVAENDLDALCAAVEEAGEE